nr:MAG TPA: hypothetical protein [Caudoviricetes sp.]
MTLHKYNDIIMSSRKARNKIKSLSKSYQPNDRHQTK